MNYDINMNDVELLNLSEEEILHYENIGHKYNINPEEKTIELKKEIAKENKIILENNINSELEKNEFIELNFIGNATWANQYFNGLGSADNMLCPMLLAKYDIGGYFNVVATNKKLMIYEINHLYDIKRTYIVNNSDIKKIKIKENKNSIKFTFVCDKDKYNNFRESSSLFTHMYVYKRVHMELYSEDRYIIKKFFQKNFK